MLCIVFFILLLSLIIILFVTPLLKNKTKCVFQKVTFSFLYVLKVSKVITVAVKIDIRPYMIVFTFLEDEVKGKCACTRFFKNTLWSIMMFEVFEAMTVCSSEKTKTVLDFTISIIIFGGIIDPGFHLKRK